LQINMIAEEEITKLMQMVTGLYKFLKIDEGEEAELKEMLKPTDPPIAVRSHQEQLKREEGAL